MERVPTCYSTIDSISIPSRQRALVPMSDQHPPGTAGMPCGPIRPEHATDGWELCGTHAEYWLARRHRTYVLQIQATAARTCALRVYSGETLVREASASSVEYAKYIAQQWINEHRST
ncbi:hypothetical protein [Nocardia terpenica]|uniref:hypothetical protein n=1 Tax=Nocardia terpenica TaxID=455432 RepID=UPI001EEB7185|nr:hypothetical protein [Nocardia terpenica]